MKRNSNNAEHDALAKVLTSSKCIKARIQHKHTRNQIQNPYKLCHTQTHTHSKHPHTHTHTIVAYVNENPPLAARFKFILKEENDETKV